MVALPRAWASSSRHCRGRHDLGPQPLRSGFGIDLVESPALRRADLAHGFDRRARASCAPPERKGPSRAQIAGEALFNDGRAWPPLVAAGRRRVGARAFGGVRVSAGRLMFVREIGGSLLLGLAAG